MPRRKIPCPQCGNPMSADAKHGCCNCSHGGRPAVVGNKAYAQELGINYRTVRRLGGAARLRSLAPEFRNLLLKPMCQGRTQKIAKGGLAARGMPRRGPARAISPLSDKSSREVAS